LSLALFPLTSSGAGAATNPISALTVSGSPFAAALAPLPTSVSVRLTLPVRARTKLLVTKLNGTVVTRLIPLRYLGAGTYVRSWSGRNGAGATVPDGEYLIKAVATRNGSSQTVTRRIRKGLPQIYPANPGAIVIVVDPGHGGRFPGAAHKGAVEKHLNLDIGLRLRDLLGHAGVQVVMTRTTDVAVLEPKSDYNGDGVMNRYDDDLMRNDIKNGARADVAVHVHNNGSRDENHGGTGTYIPEFRTWTPIAGDLATGLVAEQYAALSPYTSPQFVPVSEGVQFGRFYYYMAPYDPPSLPRPSLVTSVLSESLYVTGDADVEMLKRADVRTSLAAAIYIGLARWLNTRALGIGYEMLSGPSGSITVGSQASYRVRITNRGNEPSSQWRLQLHNVPAVPLYDGSGALGSLMGQVDVPDGLPPGQSVDVQIEAQAPSTAGSWLVKADIRMPGGAYASTSGVVPLQVGLTTGYP
jgi:N-acetylmuramoyl-L-alanine amidase